MKLKPLPQMQEKGLMSYFLRLWFSLRALGNFLAYSY